MVQNFTRKELKIFSGLVENEIERFVNLTNSTKEYINPSTFEHKINYLNKLSTKINNEINELNNNEDNNVKEFALTEVKRLLTNELLIPCISVTNEHERRTKEKVDKIIDLLHFVCKR